MFYNFQLEDNDSDINHFLKYGYIIKKTNEKDRLNKLKKKISNYICKELKISNYEIDPEKLFNNLHKKIKVKNLNNLRISIFKFLNKDNTFKKDLYFIAKNSIEKIVGNELAIQRNLNLSIQFPKDTSSILNAHLDTFSGESPFQIVLWLPLMDVYKTKSMFLIPIEETKKILKNFTKFSKKGFGSIVKNNKKKKFLNIKSDEYLIFSPNILHGNTKNLTKDTRISLNTRFKGLFTPYNNIEGNDRKLGYFYQPLNIKPASIVGLNFKLPIKNEKKR